MLRTHTHTHVHSQRKRSEVENFQLFYEILTWSHLIRFFKPIFFRMSVILHWLFCPLLDEFFFTFLLSFFSAANIINNHLSVKTCIMWLIQCPQSQSVHTYCLYIYTYISNELFPCLFEVSVNSLVEMLCVFSACKKKRKEKLH